MNKKYELTGETKTIQGENGAVTLHRIRAVTPFVNVKAGQLGGWIESEQNLSQEGNAWVYEESQVYGNARVEGNAEIRGNARVFENAKVSGYACMIQDNVQIFGFAHVDGQSVVRGEAKIHGSAQVSGQAQIYDNADISGQALVDGKSEVYGNARVDDYSHVYDSAKVSGSAEITESATIYGNARITDNAVISYAAEVSGNAKISENAAVSASASVSGNARLFGNAFVYINAIVKDDSYVYGDAEVSGNAQIYENAKVYGSARVSDNARVYGNADISGDVIVNGDKEVFVGDNPSAFIQESSLEGWHWKNYENSASLYMPDGKTFVCMDYDTKEVAYYNYNKMTEGRPFREGWTLPCGVNASVEEVRETIINDFEESSLRYLPAEMRPQLSDEPLMKQFADIPQYNMESPETRLERVREERMQIRLELRVNGFKANSTLVANIEHLNEMTGKRNALQDIKELAKNANISAEAKEVVGVIVDNLQQQEMKMQAPEPPTPAVEPA